MGTFVTLAEVLETRGSPLDEDEVWCLLLATTEALLGISKKGKPLVVSFPPYLTCSVGEHAKQTDALLKNSSRVLNITVSVLLRFRQHVQCAEPRVGTAVSQWESGL